MAAALPCIDLSTIEPLTNNPKLRQHLDANVREFFQTYSIRLNDGVIDRLGQALREAVSKLPGRLNNIRVIHLLFGTPPAYVFQVGVGHAVYIPDVSVSPIATTWGSCIYLDACKLAEIDSKPFDLAAVFIVEEFVHSLFGVADEAMAKELTCSLFGGIIFDNGYHLEGE